MKRRLTEIKYGFTLIVVILKFLQPLYAQDSSAKEEIGLIVSNQLYAIHLMYKAPLNFENNRYFKAHAGFSFFEAQYPNFALRTGFSWENRVPVWNQNAFYYGLALSFEYVFYNPPDYFKSRYFYPGVGYNCGFRFILFKKLTLAIEVQPTLVSGLTIKDEVNDKNYSMMPVSFQFARQISLGYKF